MKIDLYKKIENLVDSILTEREIGIDFRDDDEFSNFMLIMNSYDFNMNELRTLFIWSYILDTMAASLDDVNFFIEFSSWNDRKN